MKLQLTSLQSAITLLGEALQARAQEPKNRLLQDASIQRFEYTYELCHKMLKRYLAMTEASRTAIEEMSFPDLIRTASEKSLILSDWEQWRLYRHARNLISHTYDKVKADEVSNILPRFLQDAEYLLQQLSERNS